MFRTPTIRPRPAIVSYEERLSRDPEWAMSEGSRHFEEKSSVQLALQRICARLRALGLPYAVAGGLALFRHGYRRFTDDVDILVTRESLKVIHKELTGLGYLPPFQGSKHLRDTELGVKIEFLVTGDFPGDGQPKPVSFPDPKQAAVEFEGISYINLPTVVELKLASGMTNPDRMKDLADVLELIKVLQLPGGFRDRLNPFVQEKYDELWRAQAGPRRYLTLWRNKFLTSEAKSIDDMIASLQDAADTLRAMKQDGVTLETAGGTGDDYAYLVTTDPEVARKYGMEDEREFWGEDPEEDVPAQDPD